MQDRIPLYPGRVQLIPVDGQENTFDLVRADQATQAGDPLNKGTLLSDESAARQGLGADAVPDDMWAGLVPVGGVIWLASQTIIDGFLLCDGSLISRTDYAKLFEIIGTTFGAGDESTTFALPDMRAAFVRGAGSQGGYSAAFGAKQDATACTIANPYASLTKMQNPDKVVSYTGPRGANGDNMTLYWSYVRPYNIALTPIIKY